MAEKRDPRRGSLLRCLLLTGLPSEEFATIIKELVSPIEVTLPDKFAYMPRGIRRPKEAELHKATRFLSKEQREELQDWWLKVKSGNARTPNWDIACQCEIEGRSGLILVEAKAHVGECDPGPKKKDKKTNIDNHKRIGRRISQAGKALNDSDIKGWDLKRDKHYQLCNRFAWSWKLAQMGIPVILVYLGFLNAWEMDYGKRTLLHTHDDWVKCVEDYSKERVPTEIWHRDRPLVVINEKKRTNTPMWALIRSMELGFKVHGG